MATPLNRGGLTPKSERTAYETNDTLRDARWIDSALEGDQHRHSSQYCPNPNATAADGPEPSGVQRSVTRRAFRLQPRVKPRLTSGFILLPFEYCIEITRVANGIIVSENFLVAVQPQVVEHCKVTTGAGRMDQKHA